MRSKLFFPMAIFVLMFFGCSSPNQNPTALPESGNVMSEGQISDQTIEGIHPDLWNVVFDLESLSAEVTPARDLLAHFNVKSRIPTPTIVVNSWDPDSHTIDVDVTISNPYTVVGYDVRLIILTDAIGHTLLNSDDWTRLFDIPGGNLINPFKAYNKTITNRQFVGPSASTENLLVLLPGGIPSVNFAIDASFPTNCSEPYQIDTFTQDPLYDTSGSAALISVQVDDWQDDITLVRFSIPDIAGTQLVEFTHDSGNLWTATLFNDMPAPEGDYSGIIEAVSGGISLYDRVSVQVSHPADYEFNVNPYMKFNVLSSDYSDLIFTPNGFNPNEMQSRQRGLESAVAGPDRVYAVFYAVYADVPGVYLAYSDDNGTTWETKLVRQVTSGYEYTGASITVVDSKVFIAIGEFISIGDFEPDIEALYLAYNDDRGDGEFDFQQISDTYGYASISVAVDPNDTNNVYVGVGRREYTYHPIYTYVNATVIYTSHDGVAGPYTELIVETHILQPPWNYHCQAYTCELKTASDGDVYLFETGNSSLSAYKSDDSGVSFTELYNYYGGIWRDSDTWIDPENPEIIHWTVMSRQADLGHVQIYKQSSDGGVSWTHQEINRQATPPYLNGYTNNAVCTDEAGNAYIVYTDKIGDGDVYGCFVETGIPTAGNSFLISTHPANDGDVEIIPTTDQENVIILWLEDRDGARTLVSRMG